MYKGDTKKYFTFNHKNYLKIFPEALTQFVNFPLSLFYQRTHFVPVGELAAYILSKYRTVNLPAHSMVYKTAAKLSLDMIWLLLVSGEPAWFM